MSRFDRINYGDAPPNRMQEDLKTLFRAGELERREARRKIMLNAVALDNEPLTAEQVAADKAITEELTRMSLQYEKSIRPGYWKRLWSAIKGE